MQKLNQKGFALAIMVPLLPVILAAALGSYGVMTFLQIDQRYHYTCRTGGISGQEKAGKQIDALLKLNAKASKLIVQEKQFQVELAMAIASTNGYGAAAAEAKLAKVHAEQSILHIRQLQIIAQGNLALLSAHQSTSRKLHELSQDLNIYNSLFENIAATTPRLPPRLAVSPEGTDIAPTYRTDPDIEDRQALVQSWHYRLRVQKHLRSFLSGDFKFSQSCSVTVTDRGGSWLPKIQRDKF